ncbi:hypothetical protein G6F46_014660 [Rhizopus delemar]|nr:hypothetical protein G6F46_014660 [Rhizopus delemar]
MLPLAAAHAQSIAQASAQAAARGYRIPAGALAEALPRFADSAGVTVLFDAKLVGQRRTDGLEGTYSVNEGFARLLAGSGLAWLPEDQVQPMLDDGRLQSVLDDWCPHFDGYYAYYPSRRHVTVAMRTVLAALRGPMGS